MCKAEGPEAQVGGGVGDGPQAVLDGVDSREHQYLTRRLLRMEENKNKNPYNAHVAFVRGIDPNLVITGYKFGISIYVI